MPLTIRYVVSRSWDICAENLYLLWNMIDFIIFKRIFHIFVFWYPSYFEERSLGLIVTLEILLKDVREIRYFSVLRNCNIRREKDMGLILRTSFCSSEEKEFQVLLKVDAGKLPNHVIPMLLCAWFFSFILVCQLHIHCILKSWYHNFTVLNVFHEVSVYYRASTLLDMAARLKVPMFNGWTTPCGNWRWTKFWSKKIIRVNKETKRTWRIQHLCRKGI